MNKLILFASGLSIIGIIAVIIVYAMSQGVDVLSPQGAISAHQRDLFWLAIILGLTALIPVFIMTIMIISRYHTGNKKSATRYSFNWEVKSAASWIWAGFVVLVITVLAVVMVKSTYSIDPYNSLAEEGESAMQVRVVALPWRWLFIYPEEHIATINELVIPVDQPITFELTADAPMSSFWIPKLGGMIYTMEGMVTNLNLKATSPGVFDGYNAEINGEGYSGMRFKTKAVTTSEYEAWIAQVKSEGSVLDTTAYEKLAKPSKDSNVQYYASADPALFGHILSKFMTHDHEDQSSASEIDHSKH